MDTFQLPYFQEGIVAVLLLSILSGFVGSWVVLHGRAFFTHAVGTAAFPGLVLADGLGFAATLGAFGAAIAFTLLALAAGRGRRTSIDTATALVLAGCLALGVILASDVFESGANIESLLFGSLLLIDSGDNLLAGAVAALALVATAALGERWLARGFEPETAATLRSGGRWIDLALLGLIALAATAALTAVGAIMVSAILVIPAATVRLVTRSVASLQLGSAALAAAEGVFGLWLSVQTDAPPGATIAVTSGVIFGFVAAWKALGAHGRRRIRLAGAATVILLVTGCGADQDSNETTVVATTAQVADLVGQVGGKAVRVETILEPNADPHDYEPRPSDVGDVADAAIVFRSGGDLDEWSGELIADSGSGADLVDLSADLPIVIRGGQDHAEETAHGDGDEEHAEGEVDPHWWHDPRNVAAAAGVVATELIAAAPESERLFKRNADRYVAEVERLDGGIAACMAAVPAADRKLVTDHDALGYFANRYGIEVIGTVIPALTTEAQPSAGELAELAEVISEEQVKAIFPEASGSGGLTAVLAGDTGASAEYELYGDGLGHTGSPAATYLGMEEANADAMVRGFSGGRRGCEIEGVG